MGTIEAAQGWQLAARGADAYERYLVPAIFAGCAQELVEAAAPGPGARVLDLGTGTGIVTRTVAPRVQPRGHVVGVDVNADMLDVARRAGAGDAAAIRWERADATALPFDDGAFDLALCQQALQFVSDRQAAADELHRVLDRGGRALISTWRGIEDHPAYGAFGAVIGRHLGPEAASGFAAVFSLGAAEDVERLLETSGFAHARSDARHVTVRYPSPTALLWQEVASSPLAALVDDLPEAARRSLADDAAAALAPWAGPDGVRVTLSYHLTEANR